MNRPLLGAVLAVVIVAGILYFREGPAPEPPPETRAAAPAPAPVEKAPEPEPEPEPEAPRRPAPAKPTPPPAVAKPAAPTLATLTLTSDIPGASVFIDRAFVGNTPLTLERLAPGTKRVQLTATGFDSVQKDVELVAGANNVTVRIKEVRLNTKVDVVHKHGIGSCNGTLTATLDGLRYETTNKNDAFNLPYAKVEQFAVDYLDKNLKVKQQGAKTWNFTDKNDNADALFVFHRETEAARKKLAEGYAPVK